MQFGRIRDFIYVNYEAGAKDLPRWVGPVIVTAKLPDDNYRVGEETGEEILRPYHRSQLKLAGEEAHGEYYYIDQILAHRYAADGSEEFHVKWMGFGLNQATWEPARNIPASIREAYLRGALRAPRGNQEQARQAEAAVDPRRAADERKGQDDAAEQHRTEARVRGVGSAARDAQERSWAERIVDKRIAPDGESMYRVAYDNYPAQWLRASASALRGNRALIENTNIIEAFERRSDKPAGEREQR